MPAPRVADSRSPPADAPSVAEVTARIKEQLEGRFADVWVTGEISNLTRASSGHVYLSLKDESALLRGVIWRTTICCSPLSLSLASSRSAR